MSFLGRGPASEIEAAIEARRRAERIEAAQLLVFTPEELAGLTTELRGVLDMLVKRRLAQPSEPSLADLLHIRQQFEQFCENRTGDPVAYRLAAQLR